MKIKKNDNVIILKGKDSGKKGKVIKTFPKKGKVVIEGLNTFKRHERSRREGKKGEIVDVPMPISVSNVSLIDPKENKPTRVGFKVEGDKKIRVAKKSGQKI